MIFAAGMSLMDTADGAFMSKAYGWAFTNPLRKIYYNITTTGLSVFVALLIGTIEFVQVIAPTGYVDSGFFSSGNRTSTSRRSGSSSWDLRGHLDRLGRAGTRGAGSRSAGRA